MMTTAVVSYLLPVIFQQPVNLICRNHDRADGCIMIQGVNDQGDEFAHVGSDEIRLFFRTGRKIGEIGCDHTVDIALFIIVVEFIKAVGE